MNFFEQNRNLILTVLAIIAVIYLFRMMRKKESYQDDASEGGGRGLTGRGLKVHRFIPNGGDIYILLFDYNLC